MGTLQDQELMPQNQYLGLQSRVRSKATPQSGEQRILNMASGAYLPPHHKFNYFNVN